MLSAVNSVKLLPKPSPLPPWESVQSSSQSFQLSSHSNQMQSHMPLCCRHRRLSLLPTWRWDNVDTLARETIIRSNQLSMQKALQTACQSNSISSIMFHTLILFRDVGLDNAVIHEAEERWIWLNQLMQFGYCMAHLPSCQGLDGASCWDHSANKFFFLFLKLDTFCMFLSWFSQLTWHRVLKLSNSNQSNSCFDRTSWLCFNFRLFSKWAENAIRWASRHSTVPSPSSCARTALWASWAPTRRMWSFGTSAKEATNKCIASSNKGLTSSNNVCYWKQ